MIKDGWDKKEGVKIFFGRWQDVITEVGTFDGIFFDTYGERYEEMMDFHRALPTILRPDGLFAASISSPS